MNPPEFEYNWIFYFLASNLPLGTSLKSAYCGGSKRLIPMFAAPQLGEARLLQLSKIQFSFCKKKRQTCHQLCGKRLKQRRECLDFPIYHTGPDLWQHPQLGVFKRPINYFNERAQLPVILLDMVVWPRSPAWSASTNMPTTSSGRPLHATNEFFLPLIS